MTRSAARRSGKSCGWSIPSGRKSSRRATRSGSCALMEVYAHRRDDHRARRPYKGVPAAVCFPPLCAHVERAGTAYKNSMAARTRWSPRAFEEVECPLGRAFGFLVPRCSHRIAMRSPVALQASARRRRHRDRQARILPLCQAPAHRCGATGSSGCRGRNTRRRTIFSLPSSKLAQPPEDGLTRFDRFLIGLSYTIEHTPKRVNIIKQSRRPWRKGAYHAKT